MVAASLHPSNGSASNTVSIQPISSRHFQRAGKIYEILGAIHGVYITDRSAFLLLSFGRDGIPDRNDYRLPRPNERVIFVKTCGQWDCDQIISNLDMHQGCGK